MEQKMMKACMCTGLNQLEYRDIPVPQIEDPEDAIVRFTMGTICTSDVHSLRTMYTHDRTVGHEFCGEVVEVGSGCKKVKVGQRYLVLPAQYCGECAMCKMNMPALCQHPQGGCWGCTQERADGAFKEYIRVKWADRMMVPIPDGCTEEDVLMNCDVLTTGRFLVENAGIKEGDTVAVIGAGPIGMAACLCAKKIFKAKTVIAVDINQFRLDTCVERGIADYIINPRTEDLTARIYALTDNMGVDIAADTSGTEDCLDTMIGITRVRGAIATISADPRPKTFSLLMFGAKNLTLYAGLQNFHGVEEMQEMIGRGELDTKWMITHKKPLNDAIEGFDVFGSHRDNCIKWGITPWDHSRD